MRFSLTDITVWGCAFILGIVTSFYTVVSLTTLLFLVLVSLVVLFLLPYFLRSKQVAIYSVTFGVVLSAFLCGAMRTEIADMFFESQHVPLNAEIEFNARIVSEADETETRSRYIISIQDTNSEEIARARISIELFPQFLYGDIVRVRGIVSLPESFITENGTMFDYPAYLQAKGVSHIVAVKEIEKIGVEYGLRRGLFVFKNTFVDSLKRVLSEPHASLASGILLGVESSLGDTLLELFRIVGLIHIIVLSGYNVTIVAEWIMRIAGSVLPRAGSLVFGVLAICTFAILTGLTATVVRASVMALLALLARATGNTYDIGRALIIAGVIMLLVNPYLVVSDPSFQLSFIASFGLIYGAPAIERFLCFIRNVHIREVASATIATQIAVLPMILSFSGLLSLVSVPVNVLSLAVIPFAMLSAFGAGLLGMVSTVLATPFTVATYVLLEYVLRVVRAFGNLPFTALEVGIPSVLGMTVMYVVILYGYIKIKPDVSRV